MSLSSAQQFPRPRATARINSKLEKQLGAYLAAAGAAGIGLAALSPQAEATIVYTPANMTIIQNTLTPIDLNADGFPDLTISFYQGSHSVILWGGVPTGNGLRLNASHHFAAAGLFGVPVGIGGVFGGGKNIKLEAQGGYGSFTFMSGPWLNVNNRYLGVKFLIGTSVHYGWVRMNVSTSVVVTGYAYETTPNTSIRDGSTSGPTEVGSVTPAGLAKPVAPPTSLGLLALGADGLSMWRREEEALA